ncbi:cytidylyltransferase domain-containing protein [Thalassospira lohafexi]|uniref:cytidylyltransferase domain-containing protein n=1 Tax=Thalassospira lohafexi TaxID=744227 RepID=UPI001F0C46EC|nr:glycosyltransferase family protein [Thalassospira lohafexi]
MIKTAVTIQARMTSTRLPGKILKPAMGRPLLEFMVERLRRISASDEIILCTTHNDTDDVLVEYAKQWGILCYRGSENDVMSRVLGAAEHYDVETIIETTSDCPLIDPEICNQVYEEYISEEADYCSNVYKRCYPIGMDVQIFSTKILADAFSRTNDPEEREHVSLFIYRHPELYDLRWIEAPEHQFDPKLRLTLDTPEDYQVISRIFESLYPHHPEFTLDDVLNYLSKNQWLRDINNDVQHKWVKY